VHFETDVAPAAWIKPRLRPHGSEVGMTVPNGFEAYARIFFSLAGDGVAEEDEAADQERVTWTEMARRNGRVAHALMELETILAPGQDAPHANGLSHEQFATLLPILARHTTSSRSWFLLWDGFGDLPRSGPKSHPRVRHLGRNFYLLSGPLDEYAHFSNNVSCWWPDDQAWCLCTDTDFFWAYLAGSAACTAEALAVPELDAYQTSLDHPTSRGMDVINDPDGTVPRWT
jgi:hypothetical protein